MLGIAGACFVWVCESRSETRNKQEPSHLRIHTRGGGGGGGGGGGFRQLAEGRQLFQNPLGNIYIGLAGSHNPVVFLHTPKDVGSVSEVSVVIGMVAVRRTHKQANTYTHTHAHTLQTNKDMDEGLVSLSLTRDCATKSQIFSENSSVLSAGEASI
jgi:hypothetical protein